MLAEWLGRKLQDATTNSFIAFRWTISEDCLTQNGFCVADAAFKLGVNVLGYDSDTVDAAWSPS
jgi:hypothetical protein